MRALVLCRRSMKRLHPTREAVLNLREEILAGKYEACGYGVDDLLASGRRESGRGGIGLFGKR